MKGLKKSILNVNNLLGLALALLIIGQVHPPKYVMDIMNYPFLFILLLIILLLLIFIVHPINLILILIYVYDSFKYSSTYKPPLYPNNPEKTKEDIMNFLYKNIQHEKNPLEEKIIRNNPFTSINNEFKNNLTYGSVADLK